MPFCIVIQAFHSFYSGGCRTAGGGGGRGEGWGVSLARNFGVALYSGLQIDNYGELLARAVNIILEII